METNFNRLIPSTYLLLCENYGLKAQKYYAFSKNGSKTYATTSKIRFRFDGGSPFVFYGYCDSLGTCMWCAPDYAREFSTLKITDATATASTFNITVEKYATGFVTVDGYTTVVLVNWTDETTYGDVDEPLYIKYTDTTGEAQKVLIDDKVEANVIFYKKDNLQIDFTQPITVTSDTPIVEPTFVNNIENATYSYSGTNPYTIAVSASDGYKFNEAPTATYIDEYGSSSTKTFELDATGATATVTTGKVDETALTITLNGSVVPKTVEPTFVNNIENTTYSYSGSDHQYVLTVNASNGYIFDTTPEITYTGYSSGKTVSVSLALSSDNKKASGIIPDVDENNVININGSTAKESTKIPVTNTIYNCTPDSEIPSTYEQGASIDIVFNADDGYTFTNASSTPRITYNDVYGGSVVIISTIDETGKTATISTTLPTSYEVLYLTFSGGADTETPITKNYGAVNVYSVTLDNLSDFAKKRFFTQSGTYITYGEDLGTYVNRIKRLFVNVPSKGTARLLCGNYDTEITVNLPENDIVTLDYGNVTIPYKNNDNVDYNTEIKIFIPFFGMVDISQQYINTVLSLQCKVNVVTGSGVMILASDGVPFNFIDIEPNSDILYRTSDNDYTLIGGDKWEDKSLYGLEPYVYMKYYDSLDKDSRNNDYINAKLSDLSGFCVVDDVTLSTTDKMTVEEQETIISLLKSGVYIEK